MATVGFNLFLLYAFSFFLHLPQRIPGLGSIRFDVLLVLSLFICFVFNLLQNDNRPSNEITKRFGYIIFYIIISIPLVKWPGSVIRFGFAFYLKAIVFFIFSVAFIDSERKFKIFVYVFLATQIFRILEPTYLHIFEGYWGDEAYSMVGGHLSGLNRLSSAPSDILNSTQFAGLIVTIFPFIYFLIAKSRIIIFKLGALCLCLIFLYALFLTGARSGLVCLIVVIITMIISAYGGKLKLKGLLLSGVLIATLLIFSSILLPSDLKIRYLSLVDSSVAGADTASGRLNSLKDDFTGLFTVRLPFGYGLGTSNEANFNISGSMLRIHNFYFETIQEIGLIGMVLFFFFIRAMFSSLSQSRKRLQRVKGDIFFDNLTKALYAWLLMYLVYGLICFGLSSWEWYLFAGFMVLSERFIEKTGYNENGGLPE